MGRILCIDYGKKRVGIAVTDMLRIVAQPLTTIPAGECLAFLADYFACNQVDMVVIGMPLQTNGLPSESQRYILPFMVKFAEKFPSMELRQADERYTSLIAQRAIVEGGVPKMKRRNKELVDRMAASIILQGFLETLAR